MKLINYIENWNEPDKWWRGPEGYFSPFEFAAMCSADYDGHQGKLGQGMGIKAADPEMKMVMGGLARLELDYLKAMKLWSDHQRGGSFPADVINFHHYSNNGGGQGGRPTQAVSPEKDSLKARLQEIVAFRDKWLPGKEIWLSEFGYDSNPASPFGVPDLEGKNPEEVQGEWLVRSFLEIFASGIDRAQVFMLRDVNHKNPNKFNSSGLTREKWTQHRPKISFYYLAGMKQILQDYVFQAEIPSGDERVRIYKFCRKNGEGEIYALWCATSENLVLENYSIPFKQSVSAKLIRLSGREDLTGQVPLDASELRVRELPVFIKTP